MSILQLLQAAKYLSRSCQTILQSPSVKAWIVPGSTYTHSSITPLFTPCSVPEEKVESVVIGGGVVGLAVSRKLATEGLEVLLLESETTVGSATSSRNSGVVHGGMYYPTASLKAKLCVEGRVALYQFCSERGVEHRKVGKLIVATNQSEAAKLRGILERGLANGVEGLQLVGPAEARSFEPNIRCAEGILSRETGIVDVHGLMMALQADAELHGATVAPNSTALKIRPITARHSIHIDVASTPPPPTSHDPPPGASLRLVASHVVNCGGLGAVALANGIPGIRQLSVPRQYLAKGNYFLFCPPSLHSSSSSSSSSSPSSPSSPSSSSPSSSRSPFSRLIYPLPSDGGLGVHSTVDLAGAIRFGPDVEWIDGQDATSLDYRVDPERSKLFYPDIRKYFPDLPEGSLEPDYAGIRPKLSGPGEPPADFVIQGEKSHGVEGLINLFGIESPGLTSCLSIADHVYQLVQTR